MKHLVLSVKKMLIQLILKETVRTSVIWREAHRECYSGMCTNWCT